MLAKVVGDGVDVGVDDGVTASGVDVGNRVVVAAGVVTIIVTLLLLVFNMARVSVYGAMHVDVVVGVAVAAGVVYVGYTSVTVSVGVGCVAVSDVVVRSYGFVVCNSAGICYN